MSKKEIIEGYKGIMDLDLTNIPEYLKKETVELHMKDIEKYKGDQFKLKPNLRYENTVERVQKKYESDKIINKKGLYTFLCYLFIYIKYFFLKYIKLI